MDFTIFFVLLAKELVVTSGARMKKARILRAMTKASPPSTASSELANRSGRTHVRPWKHRKYESLPPLDSDTVHIERRK